MVRWSVRALLGVVAVVVLLVTGTTPSTAAPGDPDPGWGTDGLVLEDVGGIVERCSLLPPVTFPCGPSPQVEDLLVQGDRVLFASAYRADTDSAFVEVVALGPTGSRDPTFGTGGAVLLASDNGLVRIWLRPGPGATTTVVWEDAAGAHIVRLDATGQVDPTFGGSGRVDLPDEVGGRWLLPATLDAGPSGALTIALSLQAPPGEGPTLLVLRLDPSGRPDPTFGSGGTARFPRPAWLVGSTVDVAVRADGGVVLAESWRSSERGNGFLLGLTPTGALDPAFGTSGVVVPFSGAPVDAIDLDGAGRLVVITTIQTPFLVGSGWQTPVVRRLSPSGAVDPTFGVGGTVLDLAPGHFTRATDVAVDGAGRVVLALEEQHVTATPPYPVGLARLDATGTLDPSFGGGDGRVLVPALDPPASTLAIGAGDAVVLGSNRRTGTDCFPSVSYCRELVFARIQGGP